MSERWPGGIINKTANVPQTTKPYCGGVWTMDQVAYWKAQGQWPYGPFDPYFYDVSLLLNGDGTNGAQNNTFLDSSTNNFTITRNGNTTQGSFSPYGNLWSNYFDGSSYLSNGGAGTQFNPNSAYTLEGWFYSTSSSQNGKIFVVGGSTWSWSSTGLQYALYQNGSALQFDYYVGTGTPNSLTSTMPSINTWHHFAIGFNGTTTRMWIDGVSVASTTTAYSTPTIVNLAVGGQTTPNPGNYWNGYLSNIRFVKNTDVYGANNTTITVPTLPLTAITNTSLLTCQSNRFIDNSSNAFALTATGTPTVQRFSPFNPTATYDPAVIGGSGYFDGSGDYLTESNTISLSGNFTVEGWIYGTGNSNFPSPLCASTASQFQLQFNSSLTSYYVNFAGSGVINAQATGIVENAWNHFAIVRSGSTVTVYFNGISKNTFSSSSTVTQSYYIGADSSPSNYWKGYISNLRINNTTAVYTSTFTPPTAPVTAISGTQLLTNFTNAGIPDLAMQNDLQTVGNAQVSTSVKKYGTGSLAFNGNGDYLAQPFNQSYYFGSGDFTVEFWFNLNATGSYQQMVAATLTSTNGFGGWFTRIENNNKISGWFTSSNSSHSVNIVGSTSVTTGTWYHYAFVRSGNTFTIYLNGTSEATTTNSATQYSFADQFQVGTLIQSGSNTNYLNGYIDDLRISKGLARYTANFTPPTAALPTY